MINGPNAVSSFKQNAWGKIASIWETKRFQGLAKILHGDSLFFIEKQSKPANEKGILAIVISQLLFCYPVEVRWPYGVLVKLLSFAIS